MSQLATLPGTPPHPASMHNFRLSADEEQVAERALYYWNNEFIVSFMAQHVTEILPIVYPALCTVSKSHWNRYVDTLVYPGYACADSCAEQSMAWCTMR